MTKWIRFHGTSTMAHSRYDGKGYNESVVKLCGDNTAPGTFNGE